jgi:hypothetical protein
MIIIVQLIIGFGTLMPTRGSDGLAVTVSLVVRRSAVTTADRDQSIPAKGATTSQTPLLGCALCVESTEWTSHMSSQGNP